MSTSVKLFNVCDVTLALSSCGAERWIVRVRTSGEAGVRSKPPIVVKVGVITILPAVVPVCSAMLVAFPLNSTLVELAGMVKFAVLPPLANCMAGSSVNTVDTKVSFMVPCNASGYGDARVRPNDGCWAGCWFPDGPWNW